MPPFQKVQKPEAVEQPPTVTPAPPKDVVVVAPELKPDMVEICGQKYAVGSFPMWPVRGTPEDAGRLDSTLVEEVGIENGHPFALLRSQNNGQTVKILGLSGGALYLYAPMPVRGADMQYPIPPDCIREGSSIRHKKFATKK